MVHGSIVSNFDRLSVKTVLTNNTGSLFGFLATLAFILISIAILIPPIYLYHNGSFFQSQFTGNDYPENKFISGRDMNLAISFRNRITNEYANHTQIKQKLLTTIKLATKTIKSSIDMQSCNPQIFKKGINPLNIKDCLMMPSNLLYDIQVDEGYYPFIRFLFMIKCDDIFKCGSSSPYRAELMKFMLDLNKNFYFQFIFTSKILDDKGNPTFQFHKLYSSGFNSPDTNNQALVVTEIQKKVYVDNSIMPWWNNYTHTNIFWAGKNDGTDLSDSTVAGAGFYVDFLIEKTITTSFRYYKKLDFLLGTIGGAVFLLYLMFWLVFSYINRTLQKMQNAEQLFIDRDQHIITVNNLKRIQFSLKYLFTNLLLGESKEKRIIQQSQKQIDIVKMIKRLKVSIRNLKTNKIDLHFQSKDIDLCNVGNNNQNNQNHEENYNVLDFNPTTYEALRQAPNSQQIYATEPVLLTIKQSQMLPAVMQDEVLEKNRVSNHNYNFKERIGCILSETIRFLDIYGARPMFIAQPQNSSCCGFFLTLIIIILSILTFMLTIHNMDSVQAVVNYKYKSPENHNLEMTTSKDLRFAFCLNAAAINSYLIGANRSAKLTFFKYSKKYGFQELQNQRMVAGEFQYYFDLNPKDTFAASSTSANCFRPAEGQDVQFGGSFDTINQAYFGVRLDPYCSGTPAECLSRKNQTITNFVKMMKSYTYTILVGQNRYSPKKGTFQQSSYIMDTVSESDATLNGSLKRTQTYFVDSIQLIDDRSKSFLRQEPKVIQSAMSFYLLNDRSEERKGDPTADPAYILEFRPNGKVQQVILRTYKIDFLLGVIGGVFLFWYFIVNLFAKFYNSYKVRAKMSEMLYQQDCYDESFLVWFLHLIKIPRCLLCCSSLKNDVQRVRQVDQKIKRDLHYLNLIKKVHNCYYLSSSLFPTIQQRNLSLIYFREKIQQSQTVKPKRQQKIQNEDEDDLFQDEFGSLDEEIQITNMNKTKNQIANDEQPNQKIGSFYDIQKMVSLHQSQATPLFDPEMKQSKQSRVISLIKNFDLFKNPPELTLDGQRDIKSIIGGLFFILNVTLIIIVCFHFLDLYLSGADFTISYRQFIDQDLSEIDKSNSLGQLRKGINLQSNKNFKLAIAFHIKDNYFPQDVTDKIGGSIGVRMLQYTTTRLPNGYNQTYQQFQFQPCSADYADGFLGQYSDPDVFKNLTFAYCLPDGVELNLRGIPVDNERKYFKTNIYNKFKNTTGTTQINSFFKTYIVRYYMSVPRIDFQRQKFQYEMRAIDYQNYPIAASAQFNMTLTKLIFTDRYYSRSRQTYNDKTSKGSIRTDINTLSTDYTKNLTFYYDGVIDQYSLDYLGGGELFGLVGGVIALFTFLIYSCVTSFNEYRMKYLIGQRLYSFDRKTLSIYQELSKTKKSKMKKTHKQKLQKMRQHTKKINNYGQLDLLLAWILSPYGYIRDNYNNFEVLRYVTLIIERVQQDINLYSYFRKLQSVKDALNKKIKLHSNESANNYENIKLTSVYFKRLFNEERIDRNIPSLSYISRKHKLSSYDQNSIEKALIAKVNPEQVIGDKVLNGVFGIEGEGSSVMEWQRGNRLEEERNQGDPNSNTMLGQSYNDSFTNLQVMSSAIIEKKNEQTKQQNREQQIEMSSFAIE